MICIYLDVMVKLNLIWRNEGDVSSTLKEFIRNFKLQYSILD